MRRSILLLAALLLLETVMVAAQTDPPLLRDTDILQFERLFLDEFMHGEFAKAYRRFRSSATALSADEIDGLQELTIDQQSRYAGVHGDPVDFILISTKTLAGAIRRDTYILRYEERWALTYFLWDDKTRELLE